MSDEMICDCGDEMQVIEINNKSRYGEFISYKLECPICLNDFETEDQVINYLANFNRVAGIAYDNLLKENQALKEKLRIAKEALEFYAEKENWQEPDNYVPYWTLWDNGDNIGFSKAKQALKEIE